MDTHIVDPVAARLVAEAVRQNAARLRSTAANLQAALETRIFARAKRLMFGIGKDRNTSTLAEAIDYMKMQLLVGVDEDEARCIQQAARELVSLADAIAGLAAHAEAEGPAARALPEGQQGAEFLQVWQLQLGLATGTSVTLVEYVLPVCTDDEQQCRIAAAAAAMVRVSGAALQASTAAHEGSAACQALDQTFYGVTDDWAADQCKCVRHLLQACDSGGGMQPAAADALVQALPPARFVEWLRAVASVVDVLIVRNGLEACVFAAPLCQLLEALLSSRSGRLQPYIQAFMADWPLVEGCVKLLTACHEGLVAAPGWQEGLPYGQAYDWGSKHEALVQSWVLAWPHLLRHAEPAGRQHEALALLAVAAATMLAGEARLLASMPLQVARPASHQHTDAESNAAFQKAARLDESWSESVAAVGRVVEFLIQPAPGLPAASSRRAWQAFKQLAASSTAVLRYCSQAQLDAHRNRFAKAVDSWMESVVALCGHLEEQEAEEAAASAAEQRERAAAAATLTNSLLRLLRLLPQLLRALNRCEQTPGCRCDLCRSHFMQRIDGRLLLQALTASLDEPWRSVLVGQQAPGPASLARVFAACTSTCHFLAGLGSRELALCFAPRHIALLSSAEGALEASIGSMAGAAAEMVETAVELLWPALLDSRPPERSDEAAGQWDRQYVCAMLETAAALAAIEALAGEQAGPAGRERVLARLGRLSEAVADEQGSLAAGSEADTAGAQPGDEAAVLAGLAAPLLDPAAAEALPQLLRRLLPPATAGQERSGGAAAALPPVSAEAAVLQAEALATRKLCSYVRCPNLAAPSSGHARGKLCARCCIVRYDCPACQRADWGGAGGAPHKQACAALVAAAAEAAD